ncbi:hypothetical protein F7725_021760 [Dissostichus mawsoni]|uniref:Uncharacterized protein n=1 Tax=Dissostichus mawsoni TaxID=36200 RepID=A0A7J5ZE31_DISMA|nr:hypothetical protein F7725_021760 [Dissostichus mawsoni]
MAFHGLSLAPLNRIPVLSDINRSKGRGGHFFLKGFSSMSHTDPPVVSVHPSRAMVDEAFKVQVENLPPGSPVTLHSLHQSEDKHYWEAFGHYVSDHRGTVSDDLSCGGTYTGKEAMGLMWSMRPVPGSREGLRLRKLNVCIPQLVNISVYSGHVGGGFREQDLLASALTERWYMAPGVRRIDIKEKGVRGTLFIPHAFNIVRDHPQVMSDRVGLFGLSLGSIVSISLAAWSSVPRCCVCISGNHTHARGGTIGGVFNEFFKNLHKVRMDENNYEIWRGMGLPIPDDISQKVDVGKISCPILLVNGDDDQNWPTVECAEDMAQMMRAAGNEHLLTRLEYPDAGHLIEPPYSPHFRATKFRKDGQKVILLWGGTTKPHSDAQEDSWKKILAFLQQNMYSSSGPRAKL